MMINNYQAPSVVNISSIEIFMALVKGTILDEPFESNRIGKISRLTTTQRDLYLDNMLHPDSTIFTLGISVNLPHNLDRFIWEQAIKIVCQKDDATRTRFVFYKGEPFQFVDHNTDVNFEFIDLAVSHVSFTSLQEVIEDKIKIKLKLQKGDLFKNVLFKDKQGNYTAILGAPHILFDGYSGKVFFERVAKVYQDLKIDNNPQKFEGYSFHDFIDNDVARFDTPEIQQYWLETLRKVIPVTPYIKTETENKAKSRKIQITGNELVQIRKYCHLNKCSVPTFFRAVYGIYLSKYLQAPADFVFYDIFGKRDEKLLNVLGCVYQVVPIVIPQVNIYNKSSLIDYLLYVKNYRKNLDNLQNISVLLQRTYLKDEQLKFFYNFYNFSILNIPFTEASSELTVHNSFADNEVHLVINDFSNSLDIEIFYNQKYFTDINSLERLLFIANQVSQGCEYFHQLNILLETEQKELVETWNDTSKDYALDKGVHQLFEAQVERSPDAIAVVLKETQKHEQSSLTYRELNQHANQLAHYLRSLGVKPDMPIGICVERTLEMAIAVLAVLKTGGAYVPMDSAYPKERLAFILEDTQVSILLTQQQLLTELPETKAQIICLDTDWDKIDQYSQENPSSEVTPENLAYIIYTSGSTGTPKGICLAHRPLVNLLQWHLNSLLTGVRTLQFASLSFDASFHEMFATWSSGGTLFLISENLRRDTTALARFIQSQEIEKVILPVVVLQQMAEMAVSHLELFTSLKEVTTTGEQLQITPAIVKLFKSLPHCSFHNHYGPSETHVVTALTLDQNPDSWPTYPSIGRPIANTQIYILNAELKPVPIGVPGELYIGGDSLARGYLNRPDLTSERFILNPDAKSHRLYKTGDLACYLPDGNIEYLGRIDQQVKIRGFRIELGEIEAMLLQHPDVREAVVIAREDVPGNKYLVGYVVCSFIPEQVRTISSNLRKFLKQKLPDYMMPSSFVILDALPLTPNGKVDRRSLPAPDRTGRNLEQDFVSPRTIVEEVLAKIWVEVLRLEQISVYDNFFEIGGHSLLATQVISRVRDTYQLDLPLRGLFDAPTIASLAESIETQLKQNLEWHTQAIVPVTRNQNLPLSFAQQRLWFLEQFLPGNPLYNLPQTFHLVGQVNLSALEQSINEIIRRHEVLRTTFTFLDGQPVQIIAPTLTVSLHLIDLRLLSDSQKDTEIQRLTIEECQRPFNLNDGPLVRTTLLQLGAEEYILLLNIHHIVFDGWSVGTFFRELRLLYQAFVNGQPSPLVELPIQYADFALWQRQWLQGKVLSEQLDYWKQQLADLPILQLPSDRPRPAIQTYRGTRQPLALSKSLSETLTRFSQQEGVTLFMTLLAAFQTLLFRYTSSADIPVGSVIANRHYQEIENLIGFFVNTLILRSNFSDSPTFRQLLKQVREVTLEAYAHQDLPFEKLVEELEPQRDLSRHPLFQIGFALQNVPIPAIELSGMTINHRLEHNGTAKFDLFLELFETPDGISGWFEYSTDLFDAATISRIGENFQTLVAGIVANPDQKVADLPLLTTTERQQLLVEWNQTQADYPEQSCIHQLFEAQVECEPDFVAAIFAEQQITYHKLNGRANQLARHLQTLGVGPDVLVGICVERSLEMIVALLAILKVGGAYVPLDTAYPQQRLSLMLTDSQVTVLLTQQSLLEQLPEHQASIVCLDRDWENIATQAQDNLDINIHPDNLAYVIYTSGSTGKPKGVAMPHRPLVNLIAWQSQTSTVGFGSKTLQYTPISFDVSFQEIFATLTTGGTLVLISESLRREPTQLLQFLNREGIERLFLPYVALQQLAEMSRIEGIVPCSLREVITAGEQLRITDAIAYLFRQLPNCTLHNHYGPSETHVVTAFTLTNSPTDWSILPPIGRPIANSQMYLLDSQLQPVPIGVPGELYIGGIGIARGYLNRLDLTDARFIPNPFENSKLYKTGDLARYLPDGNIEYLSRIDHQVKIRGFRIELGEIEALLAQHPSVKTSVVIDREDVPGQKRLVAYVVPNQQYENDSQFTLELRHFLKQKLPEYMLPTAFVCLEKLPLTPSGKLDRRTLPTPDQSRPILEVALITPRTPTEEKMVGIWTKILGIDNLGIQDNFFELGGNSLLAAQLMIYVRETFQVQMPVRCIFEQQTIEGLCQIVEKLDHEGNAALNNVISFKAEAVLDSNIYSQGVLAKDISQPKHIFLTGATGFLGAFLLHELLQQTEAKIYCLVRADNESEGLRRLQKNLEKYLIWDANQSSRIIAIPGNLDQPCLGLSSEQFERLAEQIDVIYHSGAEVGFAKPYSLMKAANVLGTQEVLRLACHGQLKPLHYISTIAIFSTIACFNRLNVLYEDDDIDRSETYLYQDIGYIQSKWVAEKLVWIAKSRGIPITVIRSGFLMGHPHTGVTNTDDYISRLIKGCIQLGSFPDLVNQKQDLITVDYASKAIVQISTRKESLGKAFHLVPLASQNIDLARLFELISTCGYHLKKVSYEEWTNDLINQARYSQENSLFPLIPMLTEKVHEGVTAWQLYQNTPDLDCCNTLEAIADTSISNPSMDTELISKYLAYFQSSGFLNTEFVL
ncbi:amino acid adenylation domain-containing protein [Nostoc edaphicum CCNP1411]|uniref:Amino acid adenylation domain-containing protein n=1 Tax=Nostoc edaphicum CCNP1411 TaxID=1472755 RepID=A0A7D7QCY7_9NOSO|nr:non-ribosomal peptide synthetase [Nostoc edaphicum]QMS87499.1 amino acid adenylation domain-containing protein [Nostoc edaphicum CCNP1411]